MTWTPSFQCGAAQVDITPQVPIDLSGYLLRQQPATGVHDPLYLKAVYLDDGHERLLWLHADLLGFSLPLAQDIRQIVARQTGLALRQVMLSATHTHSGPATLPLRQCGEVEASYVARLPGWAVEVAREAMRDAVPVSMRYAAVEIPDVAMDRARFGSVDPLALLMVFERDDGQAQAAVVNVAVHPVSLTDHSVVSADLFGVVASQLREALPGGPVTLVTNGCAGNLNPCDRGDFAHGPVKAGTRITQALQRAMAGLRKVESPRLGSQFDLLSLPMQVWGRDQIDACLEAKRQAFAGREPAVARRLCRALEEWHERTVTLADAGLLPDRVDCAVHEVTIGPVTLLGVGAEVSADLTAQLRAARPGRALFVVGYANGNMGYLVPGRFFGQGHYESDGAYQYYGHCPVAPEAFDQLVAALTAKIPPV